MKKTVSVFLALVFVILCGGCSAGAPKVSGPSQTVTDCAGREVKIPENPKRVVCLYATMAHMMAMLDVGDRIVGAADGVRRDQLMVTKYPSIAKISVPYQDGEINVEEVLALKADLLLVKKDTYADDTKRETLEKIGVPYVVVDYTTLDELRTALTVMGNVFQKQEQAKKYIAYMDDTISMVKKRVKDVPEEEKPRVYHSLNQATKTDTVGSIVPEIFDAAGIIDVSVESGLSSTGKNATITLEQIYAWDPDAIVCNEYAVTDYILSQKKWAGLTAVKNKAVYTLPIGATRWGHFGSIEPQMAALYLAKLFYPDRFGDVDMSKTVKSYYKTYFGMDLSNETVKKILSGKGMRAAAGGD